MRRVIRRFVDGPYGQMHLRMNDFEGREARPIVCLHMFPQSGRNFERLLSIAPKDQFLVAPDFPGYGESAAPSQPISAEDYAKAIWHLIDGMGLLECHGSVDLFGIHAGAKLAVEVAHQRGGDVNKIVLSSAAVLHQNELDQLKSIFKPIPLDASGRRFEHLWELLVKNRGKDMTFEMMATSFAEMLRGGEGYEWGHHAVFEYNSVFAERLSQLPHQIALLNPNDDLNAMTPRTEPYLRNGELFEFPDWEQGFLETHAEHVWRVLETLFRSNVAELESS